MALNSTAGDPAADSYAALADATAYFAARGITSWATTGTDINRENALRVATTYLDNQYRNRWRGIRTTQAQSLAWPRGDGERQLYRVSFVYPLLDEDGFPLDTGLVPPQVQRAAMEAALLVLTGNVLEPQLVRGNAIKSQKDTLGPLSSETVWQDGASPIDRYTAIEGLLRGLTTSSPGSPSGMTTLVRA